MRNGYRLCCVIFVVLATAGSAFARQGTVTGLTVEPPVADAGTPVKATATGSTGGCGAVHIDWGDGTAITYPTVTLPVVQTHVYKTGGEFNLRAQGMGNCTGEAKARVVIKAPPPPPQAPRLNAIVLSGSSVEPRTAVAITLEGTGACRVTLDFGDGNNQEIRGTLPTTVRHTYTVAGRYNIVATPAPPCSERRSATLDVGVRQPQRISAIDVTVPPGGAGSVRSINVVGSGACSYTLDFGDGNSETREATLPDVVRHNYPAQGRYTIVATARPPCSGGARSTFVIGSDLRGAITRVEVRPDVARVGDTIAVTVSGSGTCKLVVDFDDGQSRTVTERLPYRLTYRYDRPGDYEIVAWTDEPCSGGGDAVLRIRRR